MITKKMQTLFWVTILTLVSTLCGCRSVTCPENKAQMAMKPKNGDPRNSLIEPEAKSVFGQESMTSAEYKARGDEKRKNGDPEGGLIDLDKAIELAPTDYNAYWIRAIIKEAYIHDRSGALQDYDKAIELNPDIWRIYRQRGDIHRKNKDYSLAVSDFKNSAKLNSNDDISRLHLANIYTHSLMIKEEAIKAWYDLATVYLRHNRRKDAINCLTEMCVLDDKHELIDKLRNILSLTNVPVEPQ